MHANLTELIEGVSLKTIQAFFKSTISSYRPTEENLDGLIKEQELEMFSGLMKLGEVEYADSSELLVFACKYKGGLTERTSRKQQFEIAKRALKEDFKDGAIFIFYDEEGIFRFSFIRRFYGDKEKKYSNWRRYTYLVDPIKTNRTFQQQMLKCEFRSLEEIQKAFSLEALNKQFYLDYQGISKKIIRAIHPSVISNKLSAHQGALNLLNRMMFIYFIQKKGWLMGDGEFLYHFWEDYQKHHKEADTFHQNWLDEIFFKAFNGKAYEAKDILKASPEKYHTAILHFPYLNGGLFTRNADFDNFSLKDELFAEIFEFLQNYNFTIIEESIEDVSMEVNPELLGKMYEGMINASDLDDVDAEHGIVYTERPEINFMTRRSMVEVLDKKLPGKYSRDFLYHFCFDKPDEKLELLKRYKPKADELIAAVLSVTALDPTCGSGSMLIGLIQLQVEMLKCLREYQKQPLDAREEFQLKKQIISESIYGVDVKEWAVRIAELRFWLYMVADAEFTPKELTEKPLLPNLDFKLRKGNSLIQEIGNKDFSLKGLFEGRKKNAGATRKLNEFIKKKKEFITNQNGNETSYKKLKAEELYVFKEFIRELMHENTQQLKQYKNERTQASLFGDTSKSPGLFEKQIEALQEDNAQLKQLLDTIVKEGQLPFSYDIDFMEIFVTSDNPGFDLVIGNPPYVRQEDILPADNALELERLLLPENKDEKAATNKAYKDKLNAKIYQTYPFLATKARTEVDGKKKTVDVYGKKVPGRSDLYVYFQLLGPALLNDKGTFCFIISNSWLDVDFGGFVQQFLLKHTHLHAIYDSNVRSFSAKVNTVIYLHSAVTNTNLTDAQYRTLQPAGEPVRFVMNKQDYTQAAYAPLLLEQEHCRTNTFRDAYRLILKKPEELWETGYDEESHTYQSDKWGGKYLKAPEILMQIVSEAKNRNFIGQLKKYVRGERYLNTGGADGFFVITDFEEEQNRYLIRNKGIVTSDKKQQKDFVGYLPKEYLVPLIKSAFKKNKRIQTVEADALCFVANEITEENRYYIEWGEENEYHRRSVTKLQRPWFKPTNQMKTGAELLVPRSFNDVFAIHYNPKRYLSLRFYRLHSYESKNSIKLLMIMNSTITTLIQESYGNSSLGEGALDFFMADFLRTEMPIVLNDSLEKLIESDFINRKILPIFTELGLDRNQPIREQEPNPLPDRKQLDDIIFDALGLTEDERKEVYWATAELVQQRISKAASRK